MLLLSGGVDIPDDQISHVALAYSTSIYAAVRARLPVLRGHKHACIHMDRQTYTHTHNFTHSEQTEFACGRYNIYVLVLPAGLKSGHMLLLYSTSTGTIQGRRRALCFHAYIYYSTVLASSTRV